MILELPVLNLKSEDDELNYIIKVDFIEVIPQKVDASNRNGDNNSINDNEAIIYVPFYVSTFVPSFITFK